MIRACLHQRNEFLCYVNFQYCFSNLIIPIKSDDLKETIFNEAYRYISLNLNLKIIVKRHEFKLHRLLIFLKHVYFRMLTLKFLTDFMDCIYKLSFLLFFINIFEDNVIVSLFRIFGRTTVARHYWRWCWELRFGIFFLIWEHFLNRIQLVLLSYDWVLRKYGTGAAAKLELSVILFPSLGLHIALQNT